MNDRRANSDPSTPTLRTIFSASPVLAILSLVAFGVLTEGSEKLRPLRIFSSSAKQSTEVIEEKKLPELSAVGETEITEETTTKRAGELPSRAGSQSLFPHAAPPLETPTVDGPSSPIALLDPSGRSLDHFFSSLSDTQRKKAGSITRIAHFGDSIVVSDHISGTLRNKFQDAFGDAGHGYMLLASAWPAYRHNNVFRYATKGFRVSRIVGPLTKDGLYGLGGVSFSASSGVLARFGTPDEGERGRALSRLELSYLARPGGGSFEINVDGQHNQDVSTEAATTEVRRAIVQVPDGPHRFELRTRKGETRAFGVVLERDGPGVVLDALGIQGARIRFLDQQDDAHYAEELKWRRPNLIVYQFGANESADGYAYPMDEYLKTMKAVIAQGQAALPQSSCLIIGAMDRARRIDGTVGSMKIIQLIVEQQERAARDLDCAFFNTYEAMGGWGSMPKWVKRGLGQADMTHPSEIGAIRIGDWIYGALMSKYDIYLREQIPSP